ncbi:transcriptional regulator [Sphaerisporangium melleum]|uniref:Transcriptional regulator n=1 Tax=Sphaerisporangium melleum TaxID=321316 RepID=A0A917R7L0_9ACTN|nr:helix-turn-helix transcriptional regulator [Sphaerisporangium melleum]GGK93441.1 transcriptional regulator [Sphaerisporangium melleum]GII73410.1 transcriptional regulator [Sphaerisporangium melleum]
MTSKRGMTLRAQWLGRELRELREASRLTLKEAAAHIQREGPTLSRFEAGLYPIRLPDVRTLLDLYDASARQRESLMRLAGEVWETGWWDGYSDNLPKLIIDYAWLESRAVRIQSFDAVVVPGLLQTPGYMEALIPGSDTNADLTPFGPPFRLERQRILSAPDPPEIEAVLDESLLHRAPGGTEVLKEQLVHLIELSERPNITIRVLPLRSPIHPSPEGTFLLFGMPEPFPEVGYVDTPAGGLYVETDRVERLIMKFDRLRDHCLTTDESRSRIKAAADSLPQGRKARAQ